MRSVPIKCTCCGYSNVPAKKSVQESRQGSVERIKWVCPRCGQVARKETIR